MKQSIAFTDAARDIVFPDLLALILAPSLNVQTSAALETSDRSGRTLLFRMREALCSMELGDASSLARVISVLCDRIPCRQGIGGVFEVLESASSSLTDSALSDAAAQILTAGSVGSACLTLDRTVLSDRLFSCVLQTHAHLAMSRIPSHPLAVMLGRTVSAADARLIADAIISGAAITVVSMDTAATALSCSCGDEAGRRVWCDIPAIAGKTAASVIDVSVNCDVQSDELIPNCDLIVAEALERFAKPLFRMIKGRKLAYKRNKDSTYPLAPAALFYPDCISSAAGNARDIFEGGAPDRRLVLRFSLSDNENPAEILHAAAYTAYIHEMDFPIRIAVSGRVTSAVRSYSDAVMAVKKSAAVRHGELCGGSTLVLQFSDAFPSITELVSLVRGFIGLSGMAIEFRCGGHANEQ